MPCGTRTRWAFGVLRRTTRLHQHCIPAHAGTGAAALRGSLALLLPAPKPVSCGWGFTAVDKQWRGWVAGGLCRRRLPYHRSAGGRECCLPPFGPCGSPSPPHDAPALCANAGRVRLDDGRIPWTWSAASRQVTALICWAAHAFGCWLGNIQPQKINDLSCK